MGAQSSRHQPAPITFVAATLTLLLFVLLAILVFVAFWTARGAAKRATCTSQLRQLATALSMYRGEHGDYPPASRQAWNERTGRTERVTWERMLQPYVNSEEIFHCPCDTRSARSGGGHVSEETDERRHHSYQYVRGDAAAAAAPGGNPADLSREALGPSLKQAMQHDVLLVCRHHDTRDAETQRRVLIAYEDGSVKWQVEPDFLAPRRAPSRVPQPGRNDW